MAFTLLKPYLYTYKNELIGKRHRPWLNRELGVLVSSIVMMLLLYFSVDLFLSRLREHPHYEPLMLVNLLRGGGFAFFLLLLFSNVIVALGSIYSSNDMPLLLCVPVTHASIFFAKLFEIAATSSWMFLLFGIPTSLALYSGMDLPWHFLPLIVFASIPFLAIPAALGILVVSIVVNVIPPYRMRDILVIIAFLCSCGLLYFGQDTNAVLPTEDRRLDDLVRFLSDFNDPQPNWLPSKWLGDIVTSYIYDRGVSIPKLCFLLFATAAGCCGCAYLVFDRFLLRGLSVAAQTGKHGKVYGSEFSAMLARIIVPFNPQLRAICFKEARMFIRDTTQSLQLVLLLLLTFMYLYNFRALQVQSQDSALQAEWWRVLLSMANTAFGACVVSAIATRFVFPCLSLEGRAFALLRTTPLTLEQIVRFKFFTWLIPMVLLSQLLLISGAMAIEATLAEVFATALVSLSTSIGIVGLGVGTGAVFAKFDWDSPTQVTASFGSLIFMFLSMTVIGVSMIPSAFLYVLTGIPSLSAHMSQHAYLLSIFSSIALVLSVNIFAARRALKAGVHALRDIENR